MNFDEMRIFTNSLAIDGFVDKIPPNDLVHDLHDVILDGSIMEEVHRQSEARLELMSIG